MSTTTLLRRAQQVDLLDAADATAAVLRSPAFARFKPALTAVQFDANAFADGLAALALSGREALTERTSQQKAWQGETKDVRSLVVAFDEWVRKLQIAARAIAWKGTPVSGKIEELLELDAYDRSTAKAVHAWGPSVLRTLEKVGDLSEHGLTEAFVAEGRELLQQMLPERSETEAAAFTRQVFTTDLHGVLDAIREEMERYDRFRQFAMVMSDVEIPPLGLGTIRANMVPNTPRRADQAKDGGDSRPVSPGLGEPGVSPGGPAVPATTLL